jgi:hypothetical protein
VLSTDVTHVFPQGIARFGLATDWQHYLTTCELHPPAYEYRHIRADVTIVGFLRKVLAARIIPMSHRGLIYWRDYAIQTITSPAPTQPARRGAAILSDVSRETLAKAERAGAFFKTVRNPRADEDDPDYGL